MNKLISAVSPHFSTKRDTTHIMLDVILALCPAAIASVLIFGWRALLVIAVCVGTCVLSEFLFEKLCKRENTISDLSAVVTGLLLAFNLPVTIPVWQAVIGSDHGKVTLVCLIEGVGIGHPGLDEGRGGIEAMTVGGHCHQGLPCRLQHDLLVARCAPCRCAQQEHSHQ